MQWTRNVCAHQTITIKCMGSDIGLQLKHSILARMPAICLIEIMSNFGFLSPFHSHCFEGHQIWFGVRSCCRMCAHWSGSSYIWSWWRMLSWNYCIKYHIQELLSCHCGVKHIKWIFCELIRCLSCCCTAYQSICCEFDMILPPPMCTIIQRSDHVIATCGYMNIWSEGMRERAHMKQDKEDVIPFV